MMASCLLTHSQIRHFYFHNDEYEPYLIKTVCVKNNATRKTADVIRAEWKLRLVLIFSLEDAAHQQNTFLTGSFRPLLFSGGFLIWSSFIS